MTNEERQRLLDDFMSEFLGEHLDGAVVGWVLLVDYVPPTEDSRTAFAVYYSNGELRWTNILGMQKQWQLRTEHEYNGGCGRDEGDD